MPIIWETHINIGEAKRSVRFALDGMLLDLLWYAKKNNTSRRTIVLSYFFSERHDLEKPTEEKSKK